MPTSGALLINPRRRKARKTTKRKATTKAARSRAAKLGWARRKRKAAPKRRTARRNAASTRKGSVRKTARRAYMRKRTNGTRKGSVRKTARRAYMRKRTNGTRTGAVRKTARRAYSARRNTRKGMVRKTARRAYKRNPNILNALSTPLKRIPIIGGIAADTVHLGIPAAFGAISIEPVMFGLKYGGQYIPKPLQKVSFTIAGMVMGALVKRFMPGSAEVRKQFAVALATAGGAVDYYRMKTGQGTVASMAAAEQAGWGELEMEAMDGLGELELAMDGYGALDFGDDDDDDMDGFGELELAMDGYGELELAMDGYGELELAMDGYGEPNFPEPEMDTYGFGAASAADATVSGNYMTDEEAEAILAGPETLLGSAYGAPIANLRGGRKFRVVARRPMFRLANVPGSTASSGAQRPTKGGYYDARSRFISPVGGKPFGRWFWLVKLYGYQRAMQVAALPEQQRAAYLAELRKTAIQNHPGLYSAVTQMGQQQSQTLPAF